RLSREPQAATTLAKPGARKAVGAFPQHLSAYHRRFLDRPVRQVRSQFKMGTSRRQRRLRMDPNLRPRNPDQKTDRNPLERKSKMKVWSRAGRTLLSDLSDFLDSRL